MKNFALLCVALVACGGGGSSSGTNPGGVGNPDAGTSGTPDAGVGTGDCTATLTGDVAANFTPVTVPCGFPLSVSTSGVTTVGPVVQSVGTRPGTLGTIHGEFILIQSVTTDSSSPSVHILTVPAGSNTLPPDFTEATKGFDTDFIYDDQQLTSTPRSWLVSKGFAGAVQGTFTFHIASSTPTALTDCTGIGVINGFTLEQCLLLHGTAHAVLLPNVNRLTSNFATGTLTMDVTF